MIETVHLKPGCFYHIYNRGNNRENIFIEPRNYEYFLKLWHKHISPAAETLAYCMLSNHFHALVKMKDIQIESPEVTFDNSNENKNKSPWHKAFANFFNAYSKGFNKTYGRTGKLFEERFKRKEIIHDNYLTEVIYYIHANPQRHGFTNDFREYPYSSYHMLLNDGETWIARNTILEWFGGRDKFELYHAAKHISLVNEKQFTIE